MDHVYAVFDVNGQIPAWLMFPRACREAERMCSFPPNMTRSKVAHRIDWLALRTSIRLT